jgi:hypothetical protein
MMSDLPSPLKSPMATTFQDASGATTLPWYVTALLADICDPFIHHSASVLVVDLESQHVGIAVASR